MPCDSGQIVETEGYRLKTAQLESPMPYQAGDILEAFDGRLWIYRDGYYIDSREIGPAEPVEPQPMQFSGVADHVTFFEEIRMATQRTLVSAYYEGEQVNIQWGGGQGETQTDFATLVAEVNAWASNQQNAEMLLKLALVNRSQNGSDLTVCNGAVVVIDGQSAELVTISGVPSP